MGKTTVLDLARAVGVARGATVLATQGRAADAELSCAALLTLLRPVEARLDELARDLAPELRAALALGRRPVDLAAVRVATLRVLGGVAAEGPLLVLVDDAHLLDRATADVLAFAAGRFSVDPVLVVLATEQYAATAFDELGPDTIALGELDDDHIERILAAAVPLAPEPLRRCVELAEGNPLAALELAGSLDPGQRTGATPMPVIPRLNGVMGSAFGQRFERLSPASRSALAVVAADDTGELAVVVDALARLGEPGGGVAEAEAAGLITTAGGRVRFTHPLLRPVAYHQVGAADRRMAHGALAAVLAAPHQGPSRAWQQVAAAEGPDAAVASALAQAATDIGRRGGTASAARTLECAAALAAGVEQRRDHLVAATRAWLDAGEGRAAARVADQLAGLPPTAESVAVTSSALRGTRPAAQVLAFVAAAEQAVEPGDRIAVAAVLADELLAVGAVAEAVARATPLVSGPGPASTVGTPARRLAEAVLAAAGVVPPSEVEWGSGQRTGAGRPGVVAERALVLATAAAVDAGLRPTGALPADGSLVAVGGTSLDLAVARALAELHAGEVAGAHDQLLRLDAVVREVAGTWFDRAALDLALAEVEMLVGRAAAATGRAVAVAARAEELGLGWLRGRAEWTLGRIALAAGDDERAVPHLRAACRAVPHLAAADLVTAVAAADRPTEVDTHAALVRRFVGDRVPVLDVRARRAAGTRTHAGRVQLDDALAGAEAAGLPLEAAAVVMARAERAWRSGDLAAARAGARDAGGRWAACGVSGWTPRLARLQRGGPAPAPSPSPAQVLSPAELRVAVAVSEGRTNQEAAETLYLSVKTIDFHLQNIYRKLGLRSRTELAVAVHHGAVPEPVAS
jgi:DNA-binding CsgD family transcriptional regulator